MKLLELCTGSGIIGEKLGEKMVENSHIQITKGILKGFAFKTDDGFKVHYLDMKDLEIK